MRVAMAPSGESRFTFHAFTQPQEMRCSHVMLFLSEHAHQLQLT